MEEARRLAIRRLTEKGASKEEIQEITGTTSFAAFFDKTVSMTTTLDERKRAQEQETQKEKREKEKGNKKKQKEAKKKAKKKPRRKEEQRHKGDERKESTDGKKGRQGGEKTTLMVRKPLRRTNPHDIPQRYWTSPRDWTLQDLDWEGQAVRVPLPGNRCMADFYGCLCIPQAGGTCDYDHGGDIITKEQIQRNRNSLQPTTYTQGGEEAQMARQMEWVNAHERDTVGNPEYVQEEQQEVSTGPATPEAATPDAATPAAGATTTDAADTTTTVILPERSERWERWKQGSEE